VQDQLIKIVKHAAVYGVGRVLGRAASFLLIPVYTHYLSTPDYGEMEILNLVSMIAAMLLAFGLPTAVMRFYYATDDSKEKKQTVATGMLFSLAVGGSVAALTMIYAAAVSNVLLGTPAQVQLVRLMAVTFFFAYTSDIAWVYLRAKQKSSLYVVLTQASFLGAMILNIYFVASRKMGVAGTFWGSAIASGTVGIILIVLTLSEVKFHFSSMKLTAMLRFGTPLIAIWVAAFVLNYSDRFFLQRFADLAAVGVYALAYKFGYILSLLVVQPFQLMWEPESYEIAKREEARRIFPRIFVLYTIVLIFIALSISLFIREVFDVLVDARYYSAYKMVPLITYAYVIQGAGLFFEAGLLIEKKSRAIATVGLLSTLACVMLNFLLISRWNAWGACLATMFSFVILSLLTYSFSHRHYPLDCDFLGVTKVAAWSLLLLGTGWWLPIDSFALRVVIKMVLLAIFLVGTLKFGVLNREETTSLKGVISAGLHKVGWGKAQASVPGELG
jgi:O-antigen/teichoic acid export membrane protein